MLCEKGEWKNENRLERFARLCIRIGINDLYALKNNIIDEEELQFMHEVMEELEETQCKNCGQQGMTEESEEAK